MIEPLSCYLIPKFLWSKFGISCAAKTATTGAAAAKTAGVTKGAVTAKAAVAPVEAAKAAGVTKGAMATKAAVAPAKSVMTNVT